MCEKKSIYKQLINKKKNNAYKQKMIETESLKSKKPKEFWNFNSTPVLQISYDGFKSLLLFLNVKTQDT